MKRKNSPLKLLICFAIFGIAALVGLLGGVVLQKGARASAIDYGGQIYLDGGSYEMKGGTISGGDGRNYGGAVCVMGGTFTMSGGSITGNKASYGAGAVFVGGGTFVMSGGSITNNGGAMTGGAVMTGPDGTFTMNSGTISNNNASLAGGGVYVGSGTFNMNGGTITGNTASMGAAVYLVGSGTFNYKAGTISGDIMLDSDALITLKGAPTTTLNISSEVQEGAKIAKLDGISTVDLTKFNLTEMPQGCKLEIQTIGGVKYIVVAKAVQMRTVYFEASPSEGGSIDRISMSVANGTRYTTNGDTLIIGDETVTATPNEHYIFQNWSCSPSGSITSDMTITAYFVGDYGENDPYGGAGVVIKLNYFYTYYNDPMTGRGQYASTILIPQEALSYQWHFVNSDSGELEFLVGSEYNYDLRLTPFDEFSRAWYPNSEALWFDPEMLQGKLDLIMESANYGRDDYDGTYYRCALEDVASSDFGARFNTLAEDTGSRIILSIVLKNGFDPETGNDEYDAWVEQYYNWFKMLESNFGNGDNLDYIGIYAGDASSDSFMPDWYIYQAPSLSWEMAVVVMFASIKGIYGEDPLTVLNSYNQVDIYRAYAQLWEDGYIEIVGDWYIADICFRCPEFEFYVDGYQKYQYDSYGTSLNYELSENSYLYELFGGEMEGIKNLSAFTYGNMATDVYIMAPTEISFVDLERTAAYLDELANYGPVCFFVDEDAYDMMSNWIDTVREMCGNVSDMKIIDASILRDIWFDGTQDNLRQEEIEDYAQILLLTIDIDTIFNICEHWEVYGRYFGDDNCFFDIAANLVDGFDYGNCGELRNRAYDNYGPLYDSYRYFWVNGLFEEDGYGHMGYFYLMEMMRRLGLNADVNRERREWLMRLFDWMEYYGISNRF